MTSGDLGGLYSRSSLRPGVKRGLLSNWLPRAFLQLVGPTSSAHTADNGITQTYILSQV